MAMMKEIILFLTYISVMASMCQGQYATMNINEMGTQFTQETVKDEENNLLINYVPAHNGRISVKMVFDGDSDLMLMVKNKEEKCTVQRTILPTSTDIAFENIKTNKEDLTVHGSNNEKIPVIAKNIDIIPGYEIIHDQLPKKFQPHCPPGFMVYTAHTVDKDKATEEDPYVMNNITVSGDVYDYDPKPKHYGHRVKRWSNLPCKMVTSDDGRQVQVIPKSQCRFVSHSCGSDGNQCPHENYSFTCRPASSPESACAYVLVGCINPQTGLRQPKCIFHLLLATTSCSSCCGGVNCSGIPRCGGT